MVISGLSQFILNANEIQKIIFVTIFTILLSLITFTICPYLSYIFDKYTEEMDKSSILRLIRPPLTFTSIMSGIWVILQIVEIPQTYYKTLVSIALTFLLIIWSRTLYISGRRIIKGVVEYRYDEEIVPIALNSWTLSTIVLGIFFLFEIWNINITPILASAGVIGIVLGLAARETISNFFGSIALYADDTYQKGDYIELNNANAEGFVRDISIRSTQLRTLDNNIITIPNSELHKSIIKNKSDPTNPHRIEINVGIEYETRPEEARNVIEECVEKNVNIDDTMLSRSVDNYKVYVKNFDDSSISYRIYVWIKYPHQEPVVRDKIQEIIYNDLEQNDIEIPYPHRKVVKDDKE